MICLQRFTANERGIRLHELESAEKYAPLLLRRPKKLSNLSSFLSDSMFGWASISTNEILKFHFSSYILEGS